jgi:hypothetical protein
MKAVRASWRVEQPTVKEAAIHEPVAANRPGPLIMQSDAPSHRIRVFLALWLGIAAIFIGSHVNFLFLQEHSEWGDEAANALQIRRAKVFHELYGNYSRWRFHHPGPALFYAYAAGEWILADLLKVVPSAVNAHVFTGILIQSGFFAWMLVVLRRRVAHRLLLPLVLIAAALHFGAVNYNIANSSFESIWPPHVLLFPFLCFVVACASVAAGYAEEILPSVIAGGILVHGHVAQPLFVAPFFLIACTKLAIKGHRQDGSIFAPIRYFPGRFTVAALALFAFLLPIGLDALRGDQSNIHMILRHFSDHADDHKTILQSLAYLGTFFCYIPNPEMFCDRLDASSLRFLAERWYFAAVWLVIAGALVITSPRAWAQSEFLRWLRVYLGLGLLLTVCWGVLQNGEMFNFNSFFNFGLLFVAIILLLIDVSSRAGVKTGRRFAPALYVLAIPLFVATARSWHFDRGDLCVVVTRPPELATFAQAEGNRTKFISFEHDMWPWAAAVALALQRLGFDYAITQDWAFMLGPEHVTDSVTALEKERMPIWKLSRSGAGRAGFPLTGGVFVATSAPRLDPTGTELRFDGQNANAQSYAVTGWSFSNSNEPFIWSDAKVSLLYFRPLPASADVEIVFNVFPGTFPTVGSQRMMVSFNNELSASYTLSAAQTLVWRVPAAAWNRRSPAFIAFHFPDAVAPSALHLSRDPRLIGYGFKSIGFREAQ